MKIYIHNEAKFLIFHSEKLVQAQPTLSKQEGT